MSGAVNVRVSLSDRDRAHFHDVKYEAVIFVDLGFVVEEEDGVDPLNWEWDTTTLPPGEHLLTVNLIGYDDHFGTKTVRVLVVND